jgi:hypothetical protein
MRDFLNEIRRSGLWTAGFSGQELCALIDACSIRRQKPDEIDRAFRFHQDSAVAGTEDGVVFWIPLDPIDMATPTLELVPQWNRPLRHIRNAANGYRETDEEISVERISINHTQLGDVLIMSLLTPHRTLLTPAMTKTRFSIDLRAVPVSKIPPNYEGWAVLLK